MDFPSTEAFEKYIEAATERADLGNVILWQKFYEGPAWECLSYITPEPGHTQKIKFDPERGTWMLRGFPRRTDIFTTEAPSVEAILTTLKQELG